MFGFKRKTAPETILPTLSSPITTGSKTPEPATGTPTLIPTRPIQLKIKALSLTAEARIIRKMEARLKKRGTMRSLGERKSIQDHRRTVIRAEARSSTHLARTFLAGKPYIAAESRRYHAPDWDKAKAMAWKYGPQDAYRPPFEGMWKAWVDAGNAACIQLPEKIAVEVTIKS